MQTEHLKITGMTCGGCVTTVTRALRAMGGVGDVKVSLSGGDTVVQVDERLTSPEKLKLTITGTGYGVWGTKSAKAESLKSGCCG
jgi:copper chaperone CopZ